MMFPPNLKKNIRELDRQISLLETECENMDSEKKETGSKIYSKHRIRELPSKPFITGPTRSSTSYLSKFLHPRQMILNKNARVCPVVEEPCIVIEKSDFYSLLDQENTSKGNQKQCQSSEISREVYECPGLVQDNSNPHFVSNMNRNLNQISHKEVMMVSAQEADEVISTQTTKCFLDGEVKSLSFKRSISSIKESLESSDENLSFKDAVPKKKTEEQATRGYYLYQQPLNLCQNEEGNTRFRKETANSDYSGKIKSVFGLFIL